MTPLEIQSFCNCFYSSFFTSNFLCEKKRKKKKKLPPFKNANSCGLEEHIRDMNLKYLCGLSLSVKGSRSAENPRADFQ